MNMQQEDSKKSPLPDLPNEHFFDSTIAILNDPYRFISRRCKLLQTDAFQTRFFLKSTICMTGKNAAELFYDPIRFQRAGSAPEPVRATLLGKGGVQGLDGSEHRHRKEMFMSIMTEESIRHLSEITRQFWCHSIKRWKGQDEIVLYDELHELLTRAVCKWAGVPLEEEKVGQHTAELTAMFDAAGTIGLRHLWSRFKRKRAEQWIKALVIELRSRPEPDTKSPAETVAWHRDLTGELLNPQIAAVEILNLLRPTVAVSVFIIQAAHALQLYPECKTKLRSDNEAYLEHFVQEVRRFYPFFPAVTAKAREAFTWKGHRFEKGVRVLLELYGTNHDSSEWISPEKFWPERFENWNKNPYGFVPQGGGDHHINHRCPGEWIALELMKLSVDFLARKMSYEVPHQDLRINWKRLPAIPRSRFLIKIVEHLK